MEDGGGRGLPEKKRKERKEKREKKKKKRKKKVLVCEGLISRELGIETTMVRLRGTALVCVERAVVRTGAWTILFCSCSFFSWFFFALHVGELGGPGGVRNISLSLYTFRKTKKSFGHV